MDRPTRAGIALGAGVAGVLITSVVAIWLGPNSSSQLEARVEEAANAALVKAGFAFWRADASGQAVSLEGVAPTEEAKGQAIAAVKAAPGVAGVRTDDVDVIPLVSPFHWSATKQDGRVVIEGVAPSREAASAIHAAAVRLFGSDMSDMMTLASGAPPEVDWDAAAIAGLESLRRMKQGTAQLIEKSLTVSGLAGSDVETEQIHALLRDPGAGVTVIADLLGPPEWSARIDSGKIVMLGKAPSADAQQALLRAAGGDRQADDRTEVASTGAWQKRALAALPWLGEFDTGQVVVQGHTFRISGKASAAVLGYLREDMAAIPDAYTVAYDVEEAQPDLSEIAGIDLSSTGRAKVAACQAAYNRVAGGGRIAFARGSSDIGRSSGKALDKLVAVAGACSDLRLEIQGHTDSSGRREDNLRLSRDRADAVKDYLVARGLSPDRLVAVGFGPDRPIASNRTNAGRARNRRIEYRIVRGEAY
jgi:OOP family OmpA-OmpF porin